MHACSVTSVVWLSVTPWTVAHQAPLSMGTLQARILEWVAMFSPRILLCLMLLFSRSGWPYIFSLSLECISTCGYVFVWGFLICLFGFGIYAGWCSQSFFLKKKIIFKEQFRFQWNREVNTEISYVPPDTPPPHGEPPPQSTSLIRMVCCLPRMNLHWQVTAT